jgi:hypothetical protein
MGIKEVEHHAVYKSKKKVSLLMKYKKYMDITKQVYINLLKHKIYKKASMEAFNHYNTLANGKKNYLNNAKKKFKK